MSEIGRRSRNRLHAGGKSSSLPPSLPPSSPPFSPLPQQLPHAPDLLQLCSLGRGRVFVGAIDAPPKMTGVVAGGKEGGEKGRREGGREGVRLGRKFGV